MVNPLRQAFSEKRPALGLSSHLASPAVPEVAAFAGMDFVLLDMHQAPLTMETIRWMVIACNAAGISPLVRIPELNKTEINRALNLAPSGVVIPHVDTVEQAQELVDAAKYPPIGQRNACPSTRSAGYSSKTWSEYSEQANAETLIIPILESPEAVESLPQIAAIPGIEVICLGVHDLRVAMGLPDADYNDSELFDVLVEAAEVCRKNSVVLWTTTVGNLEDRGYVERILDAGVGMLNFHTDEGILQKACKRLVTNLSL